MTHRSCSTLSFAIGVLLITCPVFSQSSSQTTKQPSKDDGPAPPTRAHDTEKIGSDEERAPSSSRDNERGNARNRLSRASDRAPALGILDSRVRLVEWTDKSFESIIGWLREQGPINVVVMWRALDRLAIDQETPVSLTLRDISVQELLSEVCQQLSPEGEVGFEAHGNMIKFSTREHFDRTLYTRTYNVRDVLFEQGEFGRDDECGGSAHVVEGGAPWIFDTYTLPKYRQAELEDMLRHLASPDDWEMNGGEWSLRVWRNTLIVRAPLRIHQQIAGKFYRE